MGNVIHAHIVKVVRVANSGNAGGASAKPSVQPQQYDPAPPKPDNTVDFFDDKNPPTSGRTVLLGGSAESGKTVLLKNMTGAQVAVITRVSNGEKVQIKDSIFRIGKEKSYVNYCVTGNPTISRNHAEIEYVDGTYYIVDKNSTNKSYLGNDPTALEPEKKYPLKSGDHFKLSNEEFVFELK